MINIICHYPSSPEKQAEFIELTSSAYADAILNTIKKHPLTKEQKKQLIDDILLIYNES